MGARPTADPARLIEQISVGDREAFGHFYDRFAPLVFAFAVRMLRVRSDAEDLLQDVFLQVWHHAGSYSRERGSPEAWLLTITRSRTIDRLRSIRRRDRKLIPMDDPEGIACEPKAEEATAAQDARLMVNSALARLPEAQREVMELAYLDGLTQSEIAARLGEPLGTVKTRMRAAMERLREFLRAKRAGD